MLIVADYLLDYDKYIKENAPDFKLIGRDDVIDDLSHILVQLESSNILIYGETGVGMSSIVMGLTSRKTDPEYQLPLDIASRRFTWLDVNKLFAIGNEEKITETFQAIIDNLTRSHNRVVVIDDYRDFLDGVESMPNKRLLNMIMGSIKKKHFQAIWVCRREHLVDVLKCHSDVKENFTPYEMKEPSKDEILEIAKKLAPIYEAHHRLTIDPKAIAEAVNLTTQYRAAMAFRAQPYRTLHLIDKAAGEKQLRTRNRAPGLDEVEKQLASVVKELSSSKQNKNAALEEQKIELEKDMKQRKESWATYKEEIYKQIRSIGENEEGLNKLRRELEGELKKGRGVILLTAHFGNWEMLALTTRVKGYPGSAIGRRLYFHKYDQYLNSLRKIHDVNVIYRDQSPRSILKVLRAGKIIGMLADQDVDSVEGVFVDFFGRPAYTPIGPAALAMASGASIVPAFMVRIESDKHVMMIDKPVEITDTGNKEADLLTNTKRWSDIVESYIRRYPDQWVWMHRRWKTRPK